MDTRPNLENMTLKYSKERKIKLEEEVEECGKKLKEKSLKREVNLWKNFVNTSFFSILLYI